LIRIFGAVLFCAAPAGAAAPSGPVLLDSSFGKAVLIVGGDVMLGRGIGKSIAGRGAAYPFSAIAPLLKKADIVFGNLESLFGESAYPPVFIEKSYNFLASTSSVKALKHGNFSALSLANNHAMDYGAPALADTQRLLQKNGIGYFGAGDDLTRARKPLIITRSSSGLRVGFLGYGIVCSTSLIAGKTRPGVAPIVPNYMYRDVLNARKRTDFLVVSVHWGSEFAKMPSNEHRRLAHKIIDLGADAVIGHHPHIAQGFELYKGKLIAYSLGNLLFDMRHKGSDRSVLLRMSISHRTINSIELIPVDRFNKYFPRPARNKVRQEILDEIKKISAPLNLGPSALTVLGLVKE